MRKWRVVGKIYGIKYSLKGHKDRNRHTHTKQTKKEGKKRKKNKMSGQAQLVYVKNIDRNIPTT